MNIVIFGMGFVGLSLSVFYGRKKLHVIGIDNNSKKISMLKNGEPTFFEPQLKDELNNCLKSKTIKFVNSIKTITEKLDIIYICVPTPNVNNTINLKFLDQVILDIGKYLKTVENKPLIVLKSTVPPGTSTALLSKLSKISKKKLRDDFYFVSNPEFLREGFALEDQKNPHILVMGCEDTLSKTKIHNFYKKIYSQKIPRIFTNFSTSELIKYSNNAFLATKISFINSISNLCNKIPGANVNDVAKAIGFDPRIGSKFLQAGPGFGGSCLPKDLTSFISVYKNLDLDPILFKSVKNVNEKQLDVILEILKNKFKTFSGKTISVLGLSFKENSDDIRESRSIKLIHALLKNKTRVKVFDPKSLKNTKILFGEKLVYCSTISECFNDSDCAIIMNQEQIFKKINEKEIQRMKRKFIVDTRRFLNPALVKRISDIEYVALGKN